MKFLIQHVILALAASSSLTTLAAPLPENESQGFAIDIEKRGHFFAHSETTELDFEKVSKHIHGLKGKYKHTLENYKRNMNKAHPLERALTEEESIALEKRAKAAATTGSINLTPVSMSLWHGAIKLGKQTMECDFDTGSADIIINNSAYTPKTGVNTNRRFTATYGDGTTASGSVYSDTVSVGGVAASNVAIGKASNDYIDSASEGDVGICGLSYNSISVLGNAAPTYFDAVMAQKKVAKGAFTFTLSNKNSQLYIGGVNPRAKKPVYSAVDPSQGYWTVPSSSIAGVNTASIVDSGTSLIVAPTATAQAIFNALKLQTFNQGGTTYAYFNCNSPPSIPYKFGAFIKNMGASSLSMGTTNNGQCVLSIVGDDTGLNAVIAGGSWLQNVHAIFDRDQNRIGFASQ